MSAIFGERLIFGQHKGPDLELKVYGDEFYARYETLNGYTVVYDIDRGLYCYAVLQNGHFVSSGTPVSKPVPYGIRKHLKEDRSIRNDKFKKKYDILRPETFPLSASSNVMRTYGPDSGLLSGRKVSHGNIRGLTILVDFDNIQTSITQNDVDAMLNADDYQANGNFCSVKKYYKMMSNGLLNYTNKVVGPVRLSKRQSYYINNLLIEEALEIAINEYNLDLSEFDSKGEGIVDALSFMYAGQSMYAGDLWPHNSVKVMTHGNYSTYYYTIQSLGRNRIDLGIGTFAHESGHMLCRFPDLYDYGERDGDFEKSSGLGYFCLMSWGNHLNNGKRPSPLCAYLRDLAGWCNNEINLNNPGQYIAKHGDYGTVMRFRTDKPNEYFIVENRHNKDLDAYLPDKGLAVYHCDTMGSNEYQDGAPDNHYQCALIQADGHLDLENDVNGGDAGDLFESIDDVALSNITVPNSREWDGTDSELNIFSIGLSGDNIPFHTGENISDFVLTESVVANMIIPDDNTDGITSNIPISVVGKLKRIKVEVNISHTYRGDLKVELLAPSGKSVLLFGNQGGQLNNLSLDLDSDSYDPLKSIIGEIINGNWQLKVCDLMADDVGRLDNWCITIEYESMSEIITGEVSPGLTIPDNDATGVQSVIDIQASGKVKSLSVEVDITHSFKGDIQIELIAPSGQRALLCNSSGYSGININETYTENSTNSLKALIDENIQGKWILQTRDLAYLDEGTLNRWAIKIES